MESTFYPDRMDLEISFPNQQFTRISPPVSIRKCCEKYHKDSVTALPMMHPIRYGDGLYLCYKPKGWDGNDPSLMKNGLPPFPLD